MDKKPWLKFRQMKVLKQWQNQFDFPKLFLPKLEYQYQLLKQDFFPFLEIEQSVFQKDIDLLHQLFEIPNQIFLEATYHIVFQFQFFQ